MKLPVDSVRMAGLVLCPECGWMGSENELVLNNGDRKYPIRAEVLEVTE